MGKKMDHTWSMTREAFEKMVESRPEIIRFRNSCHKEELRVRGWLKRLGLFNTEYQVRATTNAGYNFNVIRIEKKPMLKYPCPMCHTPMVLCETIESEDCTKSIFACNADNCYADFIHVFAYDE